MAAIDYKDESMPPVWFMRFHKRKLFPSVYEHSIRSRTRRTWATICMYKANQENKTILRVSSCEKRMHIDIRL